jgi:hypothetical protein
MLRVEYQEWRRHAKQFITEIIDHALFGALQSVFSALESNSSNSRTDPDQLLRRSWFRSLDATDRKYVRAIAKDVADLVAFESLVILDNKAGASVPGQISEYVLLFRVFESQEAQLENRETLTVRLNPAGKPVGELHALFVQLLNERQESSND